MSAHSEAMGAAIAPEDAYCPLMPTYGPPEVLFVRGSGSWLWDAEGNEYLDLLSGLAVTSLGHAHPTVADAISEQSRKLLHVSNLFATEHNPVVARTLDGLLGGGGQVFFANSGAEANEAAIKLARRFGGRGRHVVLSSFGSFHGRTLSTLHATGQPAKHEAFQPLPEGFRHAAFGDLEDFARNIDPTVAAVLIEVVQGEGGVNPLPDQFMVDLRQLCDERGVLLMIDEVQTGLGRCGHWFAHQRSGIRPDVVTMAKALGNGMPIGACWARREVAAVFQPGDHATTFGGQPLATAAARATLDVMQAEDAPERAARAGAYLTQALASVPGVSSVRGMGLLLALELDLAGSRTAGDVVSELLHGDHGMRVVANAVTPTALRLAPSLLITDDEIHRAVEVLAAAVGPTTGGGL
ncbi:MAG: acetylornithine/succinylornithine family transaminase [Microthrixaceae bacterium]|nr:acetylornithine/succinylornithine family transaminase [Microthrixaceae bacterium]